MVASGDLFGTISATHPSIGCIGCTWYYSSLHLRSHALHLPSYRLRCSSWDRWGKLLLCDKLFLICFRIEKAALALYHNTAKYSLFTSPALIPSFHYHTFSIHPLPRKAAVWRSHATDVRFNGPIPRDHGQGGGYVVSVSFFYFVFVSIEWLCFCLNRVAVFLIDMAVFWYHSYSKLFNAESPWHFRAKQAKPLRNLWNSSPISLYWSRTVGVGDKCGWAKTIKDASWHYFHL